MTTNLNRPSCLVAVEPRPDTDVNVKRGTQLLPAALVAVLRQSGEGRALSRGGHWPRDRAPPARKARVSALPGDDRSAGARTLRPTETTRMGHWCRRQPISSTPRASATAGSELPLEWRAFCAAAGSSGWRGGTCATALWQVGRWPQATARWSGPVLRQLPA